MIVQEVPEGHVRALVERPNDKLLEDAAALVLDGENPTETMRTYAREKRTAGFIPEPTFGAISIGLGTSVPSKKRSTNSRVFLEPKKSKRFLVSGFVQVTGRDGVPPYLVENGEKYPIYSNPPIGELWTPPPRPASAPPPCLPTCGTSEAVGDTEIVRRRLKVRDLKNERNEKLDGHGVAIAIVDSGIFGPRIARLLGDALEPTARSFNLDARHSWKPSGLATQPGIHRVGHGTMCAYDALIAAPKATLLDVPMLLARPVADHRSTSMVDAAMLAYLRLLQVWQDPTRGFDALVVSNSWGVFHPCLEDFQKGHPFRFIDNPSHFFHDFTKILSDEGMDIVFCGNNCGDDENCAGYCASGTCLSKTDGMIMGANAYEHVLTIGGCDTNDALVGYSSRGPSIPNMYQCKPDLVAYTHFLGSRVRRVFVPDTGVSAACPVAAGCVAALRTDSRLKPNVVPSADLFEALRNTARRTPAMPATGWDDGYGHGIIDPVAAARSLGVPIP